MIEILKLAGGILAIVSVLVVLSGFIYFLAARTLLVLPETIDLAFVPKFYGVFWILITIFIVSGFLANNKLLLIDFFYYLLYGYFLHVSVKCFLKETDNFRKKPIPEQEARKNKKRFYGNLNLLIILFLASNIGLAWYSIKQYKIIFIQMLTNSLPTEYFHEQIALISQVLIIFFLYLMIIFIFGNLNGCYLIYKFKKYQLGVKNNDKTETFDGYLIGKNNDFFIIKRVEDSNFDIVYIKKDLIESIKLDE